MLIDKTVNEFLTDLASESPAPGGGSVAAVSGALGAGLVSMVCNLTIGKKGYEEVSPEMEKARNESEKLYRKLSHLVDEDINAFNQVMATLKMPRTTPEEKEQRNQEMQKAFRQASDVPFTVALVCLEVLKLAQEIVNKANVNVISDIGIAVLTAYAGLESAIMNVRINLPYIKDEAYVLRKQKEINELIQQGENLREKTNQVVYKQLS